MYCIDLLLNVSWCMGKLKTNSRSQSFHAHRRTDHTKKAEFEEADIKEKIERGVATTSQQIVTDMSSPYALDFTSETFWHIYLKELRSRIEPEYIKKFFDRFELVDYVVIGVEDINNPSVDSQGSFISLELHEDDDTALKLSPHFFWLLLPEEIKDTYKKKWSDHYKRLEQLFLDTGKEIDLEEME